ncbi:MAG: NAD(+) diphosphatase [Oscillospiraceae bacterium]|nr:NAD(+) diphosphatase [Oscillospiraceae bacterium]
MLQDLSYGRLENEFRNCKPRENDRVICICDRNILVKKEPENVLSLPSVCQVSHWAETENWPAWDPEPLRYVFRVHGRNYFLWMGSSGRCPDPGFVYENARAFRYPQSRELCYIVMTAWHLYNWYRANRFCGCCGAKTHHDGKERMLRCPDCGNMIYPRISPAVIVAITDGDRLLMSKYAGRGFTHYALIAGYTEIGETLEQTVQREVMEEVGLKVTNIRYYKSQPWGVDGNLLMGFYCDLAGDDTIHLDETELSLAEWHHRNAIPVQDDGMTLTREMIRTFAEGREPRA